MAKIKRINENIKLAAPAVMPVFNFGGAKVRTAGTPEAPLYDVPATALRKLDPEEQELVETDRGANLPVVAGIRRQV